MGGNAAKGIAKEEAAYLEYICSLEDFFEDVPEDENENKNLCCVVSTFITTPLIATE